MAFAAVAAPMLEGAAAGGAASGAAAGGGVAAAEGASVGGAAAAGEGATAGGGGAGSATSRMFNSGLTQHFSGGHGESRGESAPVPAAASVATQTNPVFN